MVSHETQTPVSWAKVPSTPTSSLCGVYHSRYFPVHNYVEYIRIDFVLTIAKKMGNSRLCSRINTFNFVTISRTAVQLGCYLRRPTTGSIFLDFLIFRWCYINILRAKMIQYFTRKTQKSHKKNNIIFTSSSCSSSDLPRDPLRGPNPTLRTTELDCLVSCVD